MDLPKSSAAKRKITLYRKRSVETFGAHYVSYAQVIRTIGIFGKYQVFCIIFFLFLNVLLCGYPNLLRRCYMPHKWNYVSKDSNKTSSNATNGDKFCEESKNSAVTEQWHFYDFRDEWLLFCNKEYVCFWFIVAHSSGHLFGSLIGGHLSDNLGRLWATFPTLSVTLVCGVLSITCNNWTIMLVFQAIVGLLLGKMKTCAMVFLSEITDEEFRILPMACTTGSLSALLATLLSFLTLHWRYYLIFLNLVCAPLLYMFLLLQVTELLKRSSHEID
ncbi:hypothetical protein D918_09583 [Trichuris suis]|nr:hypothetical protein D918_09583 [Trichuris suis]